MVLTDWNYCTTNGGLFQQKLCCFAIICLHFAMYQADNQFVNRLALRWKMLDDFNTVFTVNEILLSIGGGDC